MVLPGIPTIVKDLSTTTTIGSWITSIVLLVGAVVSSIFGKLGDLYGKKKMMLVALAFYTVGVGIAGFSTSIYFLIFARAIQGVGLAMLPLALAVLTDIFPKERLASAMGVIVGSAAISTSPGLVLGSYVIQNLGWRDAFHIAAILSVIVFVAVIVGHKTRRLLYKVQNRLPRCPTAFTRNSTCADIHNGRISARPVFT